MRLFRKYINRKLYDVAETRYVSMLDLSDVVASGENVSVTCDRTGLDITHETLCRALYERLKARVDPSSPPFGSAALMHLIAKVERSPRGKGDK
jgi:polyhydroxyalkanoate synthesis regulator protein